MPVEIVIEVQEAQQVKRSGRNNNQETTMKKQSGENNILAATAKVGIKPQLFSYL